MLFTLDTATESVLKEAEGAILILPTVNETDFVSVRFLESVALT